MNKEFNNPDEEVNEDGVLRRAFSGSVVKKIDKEKRLIDFIISTDSVDRMGDIIEVNGWDLKSYRKNPVVLFGHMSSIPPIGKAIKVWKEDGVLMATAEFMPPDISNFAHSIFRMYEEKFLRAVSVGFKPKKWEWIRSEEDEEDNRIIGIRFIKQELLEFSAVPIPANPEALIAARSAGIDTIPFKHFADEMLDRWNENGESISNIYGIDRKGMEMIRRRAAGAGAAIKIPSEVQDELLKKNLEFSRRAKQEKEALMSKTLQVEIRGEVIDLPLVSNEQVEKAGTCEVSQMEVNGETKLFVEKADDTIRVSKELINDVNEDNLFYGVAVPEDNDDDDNQKSVSFMIIGSNKELNYEVIGAIDENTLLAVKVNETDIEENDVSSDPETADETQETESEDKGKKPKPKPKPKDEDEEDDEDEKMDDDDDDEDDEKSDNQSSTRDENEQTNREVDLSCELDALENHLTNFEDAIDKAGDSGERKVKRKKEFIAGYMRELADRLDGGISQDTSSNQSTEVKTVDKEENEEGRLTKDQASGYINQIMKSLQPVLTEMVESKVNRLKGRLD